MHRRNGRQVGGFVSTLPLSELFFSVGREGGREGVWSANRDLRVIIFPVSAKLTNKFLFKLMFC